MKIESSVTSILPNDEQEESQSNKSFNFLELLENFSFSLKYRFFRFNKSYLVALPFILSFVGIVGVGVYLATNQSNGEVLSAKVDPTYNVYTSNPKDTSVYELEAETVDARPEKIKKFFTLHNAPLADYSEFIVEMADKYEIDWKLVSAIGMCEGNGGKAIPEGSYNTWGWAASQKDLAEKSGKYNLGSWENAIEIVTRGLKKGYIDQGLETPEEIMAKYAPPSVEKGGPWAKCVNEYMHKIDETY